jgi:hypothetical protein
MHSSNLIYRKLLRPDDAFNILKSTHFNDTELSSTRDGKRSIILWHSFLTNEFSTPEEGTEGEQDCD